MARHKHCLRLLSRQGLWPHMHCLRLTKTVLLRAVFIVFTIIASNASVYTNAKKPSILLSWNEWFFCLLRRCPKPQWTQTFGLRLRDSGNRFSFKYVARQPELVLFPSTCPGCNRKHTQRRVCYLWTGTKWAIKTSVLIPSHCSVQFKQVEITVKTVHSYN